MQLGDAVRFVEGDLFTTNVSAATVVTLSLSSAVNAKVEAKLRQELRPGTRIVTHRDPFGTRLPDKVMKASDGTDLRLYIVGDKSWSIDMQRYNFQFTGQRFYRIEGGRLAGQLRDVAYQATTTDFWRSMEAVGGPQTWELGGAFNCGKAQPGQVAAVSHGCPTALFRGVNVLNTTAEGAA